MIPNRDQLLAISKMRQGNLAEIPFAVVLQALAIHQRSVVLEIERKPLRKEIFLEGGVPVDCRSNLLHETLGRFMVSRGDLSEEVYQESLAKSAAKGLKFGEVLILDGRITASELYKVLQQNLAKKLLDGFTWRSGAFRLRPDLPKIESTLKVNTAQLVVTGITKFALEDEVNGAVGPLVGRRLCVHPNPPWALDEIRMSATQRRLTGLLLRDGKRIDELAAETTVPFGKIMRLLYSLAVIGIVVPEDQMPETDEPAAPRPVAVEEPVEHEPPQVVLGEEDVENRRNVVMEAFLQHRRQDAFDLLGVPEEAPIAEIESRYVEFCRRFAPWTYEARGLTDLVEKAQDLFLAGGRAFGELADAEQRKTLIVRRRNLRAEAERTPARDRFAIKSQLLDPEVQYARGNALMQAGKYREAVQQLQFAYDCDPQNGAYRSELAYCRFLMAPNPDPQATLDELEETLRIDPECGLAVFYAGMVYGRVGSLKPAEEYLQRSIKMLMPDRRPIEALKKLQKIRGRR